MQRWGQNAREHVERAGDRMREQAEKIREQAERTAREARDQAESFGRDAREQGGKFRERADFERREAEERVRRQLQKLQEQLRDLQSAPAAGVPPKDILTEAKPGGGAQIKVYNENSVTSLDGGKSRLMMKDQDGEIEVAVNADGKRTLTAKNPKGDTVFSGPVDTDEQRQAVPEQFRKKLDQINIRQENAPVPPAALPRGADLDVNAPLLSRIPLIGQLFTKPLPPSAVAPAADTLPAPSFDVVEEVEDDDVQ